ncbi:hypothetical protein [Lentibacillus sp. CBA3610]|uniref:hypothetical protein n=1 Tax=Lentibacillus sp. CBA3610 TaxID=2518176 RepID=UPI001594EAF4|nr:hypothetical protein [Lentibacillus sp. CBA3610]QKY69384.1 hypothetical protein Len3610_07050 [Lentibacillus sp. CBA3610]
MKKVYYDFRECGGLIIMLTVSGLISFAISAVFFFIGGWEVLTRPWAAASSTYSIWCVFFLLLGIILFLFNISVHKICKDVATLLKEVEDNKSKTAKG